MKTSLHFRLSECCILNSYNDFEKFNVLKENKDIPCVTGVPLSLGRPQKPSLMDYADGAQTQCNFLHERTLNKTG